ncbi:MAG TPA: O-antigen ligase family protein [Burkholderiales bacterium]|nr:O-antigen ligase family protein [Burkholderiales bacterium]
MKRSAFAVGAFAWAILVAHLLFIPYAFSPLPVATALARFADTPWMLLGSDQNVALVSRALMFLPLGVLLAGVVAPHPHRFHPAAFMFAVVVACGWALAVNFAQLWFPTRTVSLNLIVAEACGVAAGGLLWTGWGAVTMDWRRRLTAGGHISLRAVLSGYVVLYVVATMAPFDFVTNLRELSEKMGSNLYAWWLAPVSCGPAPCQLKFMASFLAAVPCGWWLAARQESGRSPWLAVFIAFALAAAIEALHLLMVSGVSQGASIVTRGAGMTAGIASYGWRRRLSVPTLDAIAPWLVGALVVPYAIVIAYVAGWFRAPMLPIPQALDRWSQVVWIPFYYEYFAPYQATMQSAFVHAALYVPVGVFCWLLARARAHVPVWIAALAAALIATVAETSKIFLGHRLPDYTDVVIGAVSAGVALFVLRFVSRPAATGAAERATSPLSNNSSNFAPRDERARQRQSAGVAYRPTFAQTSVAVALLIIAAVTVLMLPVVRWWTLFALALYAVVLLRAPMAYLVALPTLALLLDVAPITGRFFWNEFDALIATTLGVRLLRSLPRIRIRLQLPRAGLWLLGCSVLASTVVALIPLHAIDANAFSSYLSPYNAARIFMGYAWAGAVLWLFWRDAASGERAFAWLCLGLACAFIALAGGVLVERLMFAGLTDLQSTYRAGGFVSATHIGGAYTEGMLVLLGPFALACAVLAPRAVGKSFWCAVAVLGAVAVVATVSRAAAAAWFAAVVLFGIWFVLARRHGERRIGSGAGLALIIGALASIAVPVSAIQSTYLGERMGALQGDWNVRVRLWKDALSVATFNFPTALFGMGLGSFPLTYYMTHAATEKLPAYRIEHDAGTDRNYLLLTGGRGLYMDQRVDVSRGSVLTFRADVRTTTPGAILEVLLCEKALLNSIKCDEQSIHPGLEWRTVEVRLRTPAADAPSALPRPTALSLHNGRFGTRVEITRISLSDGAREHAGNGSFESGLDRWFFTSDEHAAWRVKNTPLQIVLEQGLLGCLAWLTLIVGTVIMMARSRGHSIVRGASVASLAAVLIVGMFDNILDAPRILLLLALLFAGTFGADSGEPGLR